MDRCETGSGINPLSCKVIHTKDGQEGMDAAFLTIPFNCVQLQRYESKDRSHY
jgi:hypothetical protein